MLELARRPDGTVFCAQKLIRGETFKKRLERCASLNERLLRYSRTSSLRARRWRTLILTVVIHRDLKPSKNIMVGSFGETVVGGMGVGPQPQAVSRSLTKSAASAPEPGTDSLTVHRL